MPSSSSPSQLFIGLMSGTSLDGVDGVLASFDEHEADRPLATLAHTCIDFPAPLRQHLLALQSPGTDEIDREARAANELVRHYAECVHALLAKAGASNMDIRAIGVHGQTIRHRPERGYTRQTNNPALLAEMCGIDVIADFRSRDIAAGGQGAPLVPAFHQAVFASRDQQRVVANIGGIANISVLDPATSTVVGFDTGPGNVLMDLWVERHRQQRYDAKGQWAASGKIVSALLAQLLAEPYLALPAPKSTGRDLFSEAWLAQQLARWQALPVEDVQATLCEFTATTLVDAAFASAPSLAGLFLCGGGALNDFLVHRIRALALARNPDVLVAGTEALGIAPMAVESLAFAWLAARFIQRRPGNLPSVTGAKGPRILGALYPA